MMKRITLAFVLLAGGAHAQALPSPQLAAPPLTDSSSTAVTSAWVKGLIGLPGGVAPLGITARVPIKSGLNSDTELRIIATTSDFGTAYLQYSDGATDYGQTTLQCFTTNGAVRYESIVYGGKSYATTAAETANPNTVFFQDTIEYPVGQASQVLKAFSYNGRTWADIPGSVSAETSSRLAFVIPPAQKYCIHHATYVVWPPAGTSFTGYIAAGALTVTAIGPGVPLGAGVSVAGVGVAPTTIITSQTSGTAGGIGVYAVTGNQTIASEALSASGAIATPSAALVSGGSLSTGVARYYKVTAYKNAPSGVSESGPSGEAVCTPTGSTLMCQLSWPPSPSVPPDGYNVYEGAASGAEKFLTSVPANALSFNDGDGNRLLNAAVAAPMMQNTYPFTTQLYQANNQTALASSSPLCGGTGANLVNTPGAAGLVAGPKACYVSAPLAVLGDDIATPAALIIGDSIGAGYGVPLSAAQVQGSAAAVANWATVGLSHYFPTVNVSVPGNFDLTMANSPSIVTGYEGATMRMRFFDWAQYIFDENNSNDLFSVITAATWQTVANEKLALGQMATLHGKTYFISTALPRVNDTGIGLTFSTQFLIQPYEAQREAFNTWCRSGMHVDSTGAPVQTGGTPTPYIAGCFDAAAALPEVNSSGVVTPNGGFWPVPTAPTSTGTLTGSQSATVFNVSGTLVYDGVSGVLQMTSGTQTGNTCVISANTTTTLYCQGVNNALPGAPASGDSYEIWGTYEYFAAAGNGGIHMTLTEDPIEGAALQAWVGANLTMQ